MSRYNYLVEQLAQHIKWFDNESKTHKKLYRRLRYLAAKYQSRDHFHDGCHWRCNFN